jgi:hypothetical protein
MQRRSFLKGAGVVTVAVVGGGVWRAYDQGVFSDPERATNVHSYILKYPFFWQQV